MLRLVVVPGFATRATIWPKRFRKSLEAQYPVDWVDRVEDAFEAPITSGTVLVGWSLGARVLAAHPRIAQARRLITLGYHRAFGWGVPDQQAALPAFIASFAEAPQETVRRFQHLSVRGEPVPREAFRQLAAAATPVNQIDVNVLSLLADPMPNLTIPVTPLVGATDPLCQLGGDRCLPGGHLGFLTDPERWASAIVESM